MNLKPSRPTHQGKWTREEEEYVGCLIEEFRSGLLPLAEGTSLRIFLSKMLNCDPIRISKKFVGTNYNGKQLYVRKPNTIPMEEALRRRAKLQELENKFLERVQPSLGSPSQKGDSLSLSTSVASISTANSSARSSVENFLSEQSLMQGAGGNGLSRVNHKAAACGRALLQGSSSSGMKAAMKAQGFETGALANASSMQLLAELQRRSADTADNVTSSAMTRQASCSSLDLDTAVDVQQSTSNYNMLKSSLSSDSLLDPAFERALNSLSKSRSNNSVLSLSNGLDRKESLASLSDFQTKGSFGSFGTLTDLSHGVAGGKNWSAGQQSNSKRSANSLSNLMMTHLSKSSQQPDGLAALLANTANANASSSSGANLKNLLLSMNNADSNIGAINNFQPDTQLSRNTASAQNIAALMGMSPSSNTVSQGPPKQLTMEEQIRQLTSERNTMDDGNFSVDDNIPSLDNFLVDSSSHHGSDNTVDQQSLKRSLFSQKQHSVDDIEDGRSLKKQRQSLFSI